MKHPGSFIGACLSTALMAACGSGSTLTPSMPVSVAQQSVAAARAALLPVAGANLYVANIDGNSVTVYAPGSSSVLRTIPRLHGPDALAFDGSGNLYVANDGAGVRGNSVTVYAPGRTSVLQRISQGISDPRALAFDGLGNLYVVNGTDSTTVYAPGSKLLLRTISRGMDGPDALVLDGSDRLYVANAGYAGGRSTVKIYAPGSKVPMRTIFKGVNSPDALAFGP